MPKALKTPVVGWKVIKEYNRLWFPWIQKGGLTVLDQGLFSGANFLVNILLARWLFDHREPSTKCG